MKNNGILLKIGTYVIGIVFTAGCVYAAVHYRLNTVEGDVKYIKENDVPSINENKLELVGVKKDIGYLTEKVDRNYTVQQQILTEIKGLR